MSCTQCKIKHESLGCYTYVGEGIPLEIDSIEIAKASTKLEKHMPFTAV